MEIKFNTKVYDLLKNHPELLNVLINLSPRYNKLKNPILKRTITRFASLRQASYLGGLSPEKLINILRAEVGQNPITDDEKTIELSMERPSWAKEENININATQLLEENKNPFVVMNQVYKKLKIGEVVLLESDFIPSPLIDEMRKKEAIVVVLNGDKESWYKTYIKK